MIVDASALLALIFRESGYEDLLHRLHTAAAVAAGCPTLAETAIVLQARLGPRADGLLERVIDELSTSATACATRLPGFPATHCSSWATTSRAPISRSPEG